MQADQDIQDIKTLAPLRKPISLSAIATLVRFAEFLVVLISGLATVAFFEDRISNAVITDYVNTIVLGATFGAIIFEWVGAYDVDVWYRQSESFRRLLWGWVATSAALLAFGFAFKILVVEYSRLWGVSWFFATSASLIVSRAIAFQQMKRLRARGKFDVRVVIYGAGPQGQRLSKFIAQSKTLTMQVVGFVDDRISRVPRMVNGLPVLGGMDDLERLIRQDLVDQVILAIRIAASGSSTGYRFSSCSIAPFPAPRTSSRQSKIRSSPSLPPCSSARCSSSSRSPSDWIHQGRSSSVRTASDSTSGSSASGSFEPCITIAARATRSSRRSATTPASPASAPCCGG